MLLGCPSLHRGHYVENRCYLDENCYKAVAASRNLVIIEHVNDHIMQLRSRLFELMRQDHKTESSLS
jgi:hypothetical protein